MNTATAQNTVTTVTFVTSPDIRFTLQNRPYNRVRLVGNGQMIAIHLPILDLDLTTDENVTEITERLRYAYRTKGQYHDDQGNPVNNWYLAGRQGVARQMEVAHDLLMQGDIVMHVWQGMHPAVADAILTAISKWRSKPVPPKATGSKRSAHLHDTLVINDPELDVEPVAVLRNYPRYDGTIYRSEQVDIALYDHERDLLYFADYMMNPHELIDADSTTIIEGVTDYHVEQADKCEIISLVDEYEITRTHKVIVHDDDLKIYRNGDVVKVSSVLRDCIENWEDEAHRSRMEDASPATRSIIANSETDLRYFENESSFEDAFEEGRLLDMYEDERLDRMQRLDPDEYHFFDLEQHEHEYRSFLRMVQEDDYRDLPRDKEGKVIRKPILTYNVNKPDTWQVTPKKTRWPLARLAVKQGGVDFRRREQQLKDEALAKPLGTICCVTQYDKAAHDERAHTIYVGQTWKVQQGNPLAYGPIRTADHYREWLWGCIKQNTPAAQEISKIAMRILSGRAVVLTCWPQAKKDEHGKRIDNREDPPQEYTAVIADAAKWMANVMKDKLRAVKDTRSFHNAMNRLEEAMAA